MREWRLVQWLSTCCCKTHKNEQSRQPINEQTMEMESIKCGATIGGLLYAPLSTLLTTDFCGAGRNESVALKSELAVALDDNG